MQRRYIVVLLTLFAFSCGQTTDTKDEVVEQKSVEVFVPEARGYETLLNEYIGLKNALVASDAERASESAVALARDPGATDVINKVALAIADTENLEEQRENFYTLSEAMYVQLKNSDDLHTTVYWQYCPMARDNQGANWLSLESEILNPYFGDAMLTCGSIDEEL